jgi:hypothetical protein
VTGRKRSAERKFEKRASRGGGGGGIGKDLEKECYDKDRLKKGRRKREAEEGLPG